MNNINVYLKLPTQFMVTHWQKLLPDCPTIPLTVVVVLFKARFPLNGEGNLIEWEKDRLLQQFGQLGESFYFASRQGGLLVEIVSPQDGMPQYSRKGELIFDLVATVNYLLGFDFSRTQKGCKVLRHPEWETAVYPGLFLSWGSMIAVESILREILPKIPVR